jgi:hypothetical protein
LPIPQVGLPFIRIIYCFVLKDKMKRLIADGDAELRKTLRKGKRVASSNVTTYSCPTPSTETMESASVGTRGIVSMANIG